MNLKKALNKTCADEPLKHEYEEYDDSQSGPAPVIELVFDLEEDEDGWDKTCTPPSDRDKCLEQQAQLFVLLTDLLIQQHGLGCSIGPLIDGYDIWLDCDLQPEACQGVCNQIQEVLECLHMFIDVAGGCPEAQGCCCFCTYCDMSVEQQLKLIRKWEEKEGGMTEEDWDNFFDSTYCINSGIGFCDSDGGEFHPDDNSGCTSYEV